MSTRPWAMHAPKTGKVIVFNGDIFTSCALRAGLEAQAERFRTTGDTKVRLALYRKSMFGRLVLLALCSERNSKGCTLHRLSPPSLPRPGCFACFLPGAAHRATRAACCSTSR